jgi:tetratricopeptide (TPR) repeat protein
MGDIRSAVRDWALAQSSYEESLAKARSLNASMESPGNLSEVVLGLQRLGRVFEARKEYGAATRLYAESLEIQDQLLREEESPSRLLLVGLCLQRMGDMLLEQGDRGNALHQFEAGLKWTRRLIALYDDPNITYEITFEQILLRCRNAAIEAGAYEQALGHAKEYQTLHLAHSPCCLLEDDCAVLRCELGLQRLDDASESARRIEDLVGALVAAFEDDTVDRAEQQLDSTTLFQCAEGMELVARLRGLEGNEASQREAAASAESLRESAEQLKAEEDAATDEDSSS